MIIPPITTNPQPTFGILKKHKKTSYGDYMWGVYKNFRIEIFNAKTHNQKLQYISDNRTLKWLKSKLIYFENGVKKIIQSNNEL